MKNSEYWQQRFTLLEETQNKKSTKYLETLKEEYDKSLMRIEKDINNWYTKIADNNEISLSNAKELLNKKELKEFKWTVDEYIEKGKQNAIKQEWMKELENASAKVHIDKLNAIKIQIQNELEHLYNKEDKGIDELVKEQYQKSFYKSAYEIQKGMEQYWNIRALDTNKIQKVINKPWTTDNQTFSDRIWKHKKELTTTLQKSLTQAIIRGDKIEEVTKTIKEQFNVSKGKAGRLVMTESAFFSSAGQKECFNSLNVKQYEIVATLDTHTSKICQELDGKVFNMKDYEVGVTAPPFHCWCRSCTAPYFDDEFTEDEQRAYRDKEGKTGYVDSKIKYSEWKKKYVTNSSNSSIIKQNADKKENKMNYKDITNQYTTKKKYQILKQTYFIDEEGVKYTVDGKHIVLEPTEQEVEVANLMGKIFGGKVALIPRINYPKKIKTPDYIINKEKYDLKTLTENNKNTIYNAIHKQKMQANNFIIDISKNRMSQTDAEKQIENIYNSRHTEWVKKILIIKDDKLLKVYERK